MAHVDLEAGLSLSSWYLINGGVRSVDHLIDTRLADGELVVDVGDLSTFGIALLVVVEQDGADSATAGREVIIPPQNPKHPSETIISTVEGRDDIVRVSVAEGYLQVDFPTVSSGARVSATERSNGKPGANIYSPRAGVVERRDVPDTMAEIGNYMNVALRVMGPLGDRAHWAIESATDFPL